MTSHAQADQSINAAATPGTAPALTWNPRQAAARRRLRTWRVGGGIQSLTAPRLEITDLVMSDPRVGNGRPEATQLRYTVRGTEIRSVDVRLVRGDGVRTPACWSVAAQCHTREIGNLDAGSLGPVATSPQRPTFGHTLAARVGRRSAPLEKSFDVVPPPRLAQMHAPQPVRPGQSLEVTLDQPRSTSDVVSLQPRVVEADVPWSAAKRVWPVLPSQAQGMRRFQHNSRPRWSVGSRVRIAGHVIQG